jgi:hypothetical protein
MASRKKNSASAMSGKKSTKRQGGSIEAANDLPESG